MEETLTFTTPTGVELKLPVAGAGSRSFAYLIDWHIRILAILVWALAWLTIFYPGFNFQDEAAFGNGGLWLGIPIGLIYALYHPVIELLMQGNSPGKNKVGIRCVDMEGEAPGSGAILLRNIMRIIDGIPGFYTIGLISVMVTKDKVRLGDMVAGTRMVVAEGQSDKALDRLDQIHAASIAPKDAEFVQDLLQRWGALSKERKLELGSTMLARYDIEPETRPRKLHKQLKALLKP